MSVDIQSFTKMNADEAYAEAVRQVDARPVPEEVRLLNLPIMKLPPLPSTLKRFECCGASITDLSTEVLPPTLETFRYYRGKNLMKLPEHLPAGLKTLVIQDRQLESLPPLPDTLEILGCQATQLKSLPATLPPNLYGLDCSDTEISSLPPLPAGLTLLYCSNTKISSLPTLPDMLTTLYCSNTTISELPNVPITLQSLSVCNTNIREIPYLPDAECIMCSSTRVSVVPALSNRLVSLYICDSPIRELPDEFPPRLHFLDCQRTLLPDKQMDESSWDYLRRVKTFQATVRRIKEGLEIEMSRRRTIRRCKAIKERLMAATWHTDRVLDWCDPKAFDFDD
jgi:Leucine-rich repeat (LRR) protein